ncbi:MAG: alpha/beta hydrolase [Caulobacteraceae bacterium]
MDVMAALPQSAARPRPKLRRLLLLATVGATIAGPVVAQRAAQGRWPAPALHWKPCADAGQAGFECATARAPLDYSSPRGKTIQLALIRHKATDRARRIGSLFFNPGGPGGRGTLIMPLLFNEPIKTAPVTFPVKVRERFDIVSWDPRGVGLSTAVRCFATPQEELKAILRLSVGLPYTLKLQEAWIKGWADIARHCARNEAAWLLPHVSTADTARDLDLLRQAVGDAKLTYQGNSYGTVLGAMYANLFPDKVRAMVLLGNVGPVGYTNLGHDNPSLDVALRQKVELGTAGTLDAFLELCGQASRDECAFSAGSAAATKAKWQTLIERIRKDPLTVGEGEHAVNYDYDLVVTLSIISLYDVTPGFHGFDWGWLANTLEPLWEGNTNPDDYPKFPKSTGGQQATQLLAVSCGEAPNPRDPNAYFALADRATRRAGAVGPYWVWRDEECAAWPARAAHPYNGPWNRPTANPILLVNNTLNPATPYSGGLSMAEALADARLLTIKGYGHADSNVPSTCADTYESDYFIDLTLPPKGAVCRQDTAPFSKPVPGEAVERP